MNFYPVQSTLGANTRRSRHNGQPMFQCNGVISGLRYHILPFFLCRRQQSTWGRTKQSAAQPPPRCRAVLKRPSPRPASCTSGQGRFRCDVPNSQFRDFTSQRPCCGHGPDAQPSPVYRGACAAARSVSLSSSCLPSPALILPRSIINYS